MNAQDEYSFDPRHIRTCQHCGMKYDWRKSPSTTLKMTYCGSLCENADLGFTIDALLQLERRPAAVPALNSQPPLELVSAA